MSKKHKRITRKMKVGPAPPAQLIFSSTVTLEAYVDFPNPMCPICNEKMAAIFHKHPVFQCPSDFAYACQRCNDEVKYCRYEKMWNYNDVKYTEQEMQRLIKLKAFL